MYVCLCIYSVISHDLRAFRAIIVDRHSTAQVHINTRLIEPFREQQNVLYQFAGELEMHNTSSQVTTRFLKAKSYRCVDGLDLVKYYCAVDARSAYLRRRSENCSSN